MISSSLCDVFHGEEHGENDKIFFEHKIELGADPTIRDDQGQSPLSFFEIEWKNSRLPSDEEVEAALKKRLSVWNQWASGPRPKGAPHDSGIQKEAFLIKSLLYSLDDNQFPKAPPPWASERLKKVYNILKAAKQSPELLTSKSLDLDEMPPAYYREVLQGASSIRAQSARGDGKPPAFNPSAEQTQKILSIMLSDPQVSPKDLESLTWLLVRSKAAFDAELLDQFKIPPGKLQADVDAMLLHDPLQYKGASSLAALKIVKALLTYGDERFVCSSDGTSSSAAEQRISRILNWFGNYGNNLDADRAFFSKLARIILEKKKLCPRDRDLLLNAMRDWRGSNGLIQHEIACAVARSLGSEPLSSRTIEEFTLISDTVGLRSELSQSAWIEQMRAFGQLRSHRGGGPLSGDEQEIYNGLLKFILGSPEASIQRIVKKRDEQTGEEKEQKQKFFSFPKSDPHLGAIVKLCQILRRSARNKDSLSEDDLSLASGASLWLQTARERLNQPRSWPEGFIASGFNVQQDMRQEFASDPRFEDDLIALESSCETLPKGDGSSESYSQRRSRLKARQKSRGPMTKKGTFDFSP